MHFHKWAALYLFPRLVVVANEKKKLLLNYLRICALGLLCPLVSRWFFKSGMSVRLHLFDVFVFPTFFFFSNAHGIYWMDLLNTMWNLNAQWDQGLPIGREIERERECDANFHLWLSLSRHLNIFNGSENTSHTIPE